MQICKKCKFMGGFFIIVKKTTRNFLSSQKSKAHFAHHHKKTKHTFYLSLQKKTKALLTQLSKKKKNKAHFHSSRLAKASCESCSYNKAQNQRFQKPFKLQSKNSASRLNSRPNNQPHCHSAYTSPLYRALKPLSPALLRLNSS